MPSRSSRNAKNAVDDGSPAPASEDEAENVDMEDGWEDDDDDDSDDDESSDENDSDYEQRNKTQPKKKVKTVAASPSKNVRRRIRLNLLPTMPLDILYEIFSHLSPKDIVGLSRTSKLLHETLSSRNSMSVWKAARERFAVPDAPHWMSEAAWSALLFERTCQSCGTNNIQKVDFLLMKRVCLSCKKKHYVLRSKVDKRYPGADFVILDLVPSTNISAWSPWARSSYYYWDGDLQAVITKLAALDDVQQRNDFMEKQKRKLQCVRETSSSWHQWFEKMQQDRSQETRNAEDKRLLQIKAKFKKLGYLGEDLRHLDSSKECRGKAQLTDKIWNRIFPILEPDVRRRKVARLEQQLTSIKYERRRILADRYKEFHRSISPSQWKYFPRTLDIAAFNPFAQHIGAEAAVEVDESTFNDAFLELPRLLAAANEQRRAALSALIGSAPKEDGEVGLDVDPLDLATAVFKCNESHSYLYPFRHVFGWDEIASHHCLSETEGTDHLTGFYYTNESSLRKTPVGLVYSREIANVVEKLARLLGLDAATATAADFDKKDLRFSCDQCSWVEEKGRYYRLGYTWRHLAIHLENHNLECKIAILSAEQANEVKLCERDDPKWTAVQWTCAHCSVYFDNLRTQEVIVAHLSVSHGIHSPSEPTDLFFFERYKRGWSTQPKFSIPEPKNINALRKIYNAKKDPTGKYRCLQCPPSEMNRVFIFNGIKDHLRAKHSVTVGQGGVHYAAA